MIMPLELSINDPFLGERGVVSSGECDNSIVTVAGEEIYSSSPRIDPSDRCTLEVSIRRKLS